MQLWEKGLFSLEDDLSDYLPAFKEMTVMTEEGVRKAKNSIRIRDLFQMTAGMGYDMHTPQLEEYYAIPGNNCPTVETACMFAKNPLLYEPGEGWKYSFAHDVIGALIEVISGEKFEVYVKKNIFDPLGMTNSDFLHPIEDWEGFAKQYQYSSTTGEFTPVWRFWCHLGKEFAGGGGGCVSTVEDYIKFLEAMRVGDVILKKDTIKLMSTHSLNEVQMNVYKKTHNNMVISNVNGSKNNKIDWIYREDISGIMVREADIYTGHDGPMIKIGIVSDTHFNYCNNRDFEENHPTVMSTFANRKWLANGKNVEKTAKCLKYISDCDQMVVLGDILDYLTHGAIELTKKNIFEKYPNIIACVGNHDAVRKMEGTVDETDSLEERRNVLRSFWVHDIDYYSKIIDGRVMLIQMDNASREGFVESQITSLKADLSLARKQGLAVLLFFHYPISINNPATTVTMPIRRNDAGVANFNSIPYLIGPKSKGASLADYELIINNADIIHAVFCGHMHSDYYTEIYAKTADGRDKKIPQYITTGTAYDQGHVMIVNIK
jgi:predicted phosphodiesterase